MEKIGFIGLGIMGKPMAKNLINAGYPLWILSSSAAADEVKTLGATVVADARTMASTCDAIITMLPDSPQVSSVMFGEEGLIHGLRKGSLFIDMSTIAPATSIDIYDQLQQ